MKPATEGETPPTPLKAYLQLVSNGEPFRLLFPLGLALGIFAVALWPLYHWELVGFPGKAHARIMIQGFLTAFVFGFLGTSLPRLLEIPPIRLKEASTFAALLLALSVFHFLGFLLVGDLLFLSALGFFLSLLGIRLRHRQDVPPPGFVLVGLGLLSALGGVLLLILTEVLDRILFPTSLPLAYLLLFQGYLLLPIMGIGAFLLPRFFGLPSRQSLPESTSLPPGWVPKATFAAVCGLIVILSFICQVQGQPRLGYALRAAAVLIYLLREVPFYKSGLGGGTLALSLRLALLAIPTGYGLMALFPDPTQSYSLLHVVFIAGFGLLTLVVATRVILGHGGRSDLFRARLLPVAALTLLVLGATFLRVKGGWSLPVDDSNFAWAGLLWLLGALIWASGILPSVRHPDDE